MLRRSLAVLPFVMLVMTLLMAAPVWAQAALTVEKTDDPDPVVEGKILTYTIVVTNSGTEPTVTPVEVLDDLPASTTFVSVDTTKGSCPTQPAVGAANTANPDVICNLGNLSEGTDATVTIQVKPTNTSAIAGTITNRARAISGTIDRTTEENTPVTPGLTIVKESSPGTIEVGDDLRYILTVNNRGGSNAANVRVIDELPTQVEFVQSDPDQGDCDEQPEGVVECDLGTINAGATVRIELLVRTTEAGDISNRAEVFAGDAEEAIDEDTETTRVEDDGGNGGGGGGGGGGGNSSGDSNSCQGAEAEETLSGTATEDSVELDITGSKFRISSNVSDLGSRESFTIRVKDNDGTVVDTFTQDSNGDRTFTVKEGRGTFTVEIENPGEAQYRVSIDDCTGSDQNDNNNGNRNNNRNNNDRNSLFNDFDRDLGEVRGDGSFRCEQILEISQSADRDQYDFSAERIDECRRDEVLTDTIPDKRLPDTGGSPLVLLAAAVLLVSGLFAGVSVFRAGTRSRG